MKGAGLLDYVTCWHGKAAEYMKDNPTIRAAFVSTNSITQGEQAGVLWPRLFEQGVHINFAHRTFQWSSEARGKSAVHCVIVGFALQNERAKRLFDYETVDGEPHEVAAKHINPYLVDGPDAVVVNREKPICDVPEMGVGNQAIDGGHYLFNPEQKVEFIKLEPESERYFRRWVGADEFLNGYERWCLWLRECPPEHLRKLPESLKRVDAVRAFRLRSKRASTRALADTPTRFEVENMPDSDFLVVPEVSSERRAYIPIGYLKPEVLASHKLKVLRNATLYHFGVLSSLMHMAWTRAVSGRLESRYQYSVGIVYNNFPWPEKPEEAKVRAVEAAAKGVLDARKRFAGATLADLYDPLTMPPDLLAAHRELDRAVDRAYRSAPFTNERNRVEYLFELYQNYSSPLMALAGKAKKPRRRPTARA
jgi:hypothetical protein